MALTGTQKAQVRLYLGYQDQDRQLSTELESQLGSISTEAETLVIGLLASLLDIDAKLLSAHGRLKALKVGSIELPGAGEIETLRSEGRRFVGRLAVIFDVEPLHDVFSDGDAASSVSAVIPLG